MSALGLLFLTLFNSVLGLSLLFPILGPLGRSLGLSEVQVGLFSTGYALMQFLLAPYWGRRSEGGRKPVLLLGILGFAASFLLFGLLALLGQKGLLPPGLLFPLLLLSRLLGGAFSSATLPTAQAYVADVTGRENRTAGMALLGAAFGLAVIVGPAIGAGLAGLLGLLAPVFFASGIALLNALFVALVLPESRPQGTREERRLSPWDGRVFPLLLLGFALNLSSVALEQTVAFYFQDRLGLSGVATAQKVGLALVLYGAVAVLVQGFLVRRLAWPPKTLLLLGLPLGLAGFLVLVLAQGFWALALGLALQGAGAALAGPGVTAALSLAVGEGEQGPVAGLNASAQALGRMLGPLLGTGLYRLAPEAPYLLGAGLLLLSWALLPLLFRRVRL
ncbi:MAG: MFS transporter [Thermus sp.]|uniref:MFS transporter n=1 Tax=unclassified Thermus TaxID=2619321 RepID=UPI00023899A1|nr:MULTISPECIES: MFS transporter [unclassified Thermus]AEV15305.1 Major facilitator superfamily MFS_1 [Thermus sp. CCB_US3_UF1]MCS6869219.1 MFS transporter [Thermus sp.]MCS7217404.1 MFS transporter [Thermus sp.]MCX7848749.1 MFS transporter [Thermus sp.]MDW8017723.1 MFS transporter [Thermus sp.]